MLQESVKQFFSLLQYFDWTFEGQSRSLNSRKPLKFLRDSTKFQCRWKNLLIIYFWFSCDLHHHSYWNLIKLQFSRLKSITHNLIRHPIIESSREDNHFPIRLGFVMSWSVQQINLIEKLDTKYKIFQFKFLFHFAHKKQNVSQNGSS